MRRSIQDLTFARLVFGAGLVAGSLVAPLAMAQAAPTSAATSDTATTKSTVPDTGNVEGSGLAHTRFPIKPSRLSDDGTFRGYLDTVSRDAGRKCGKRQENFVWEFRKGDQAAVDEIYQGTMSNVEQVGWKLKPVTLKSVNSQVTTAFIGDREKERLLIVWIPMEDATMMLVCETP